MCPCVSKRGAEGVTELGIALTQRSASCRLRAGIFRHIHSDMPSFDSLAPFPKLTSRSAGSSSE